MHLIHDLYGAAESIDALAAAERQALFHGGGITADGLFDLADLHQREHSYRSIIIRARDRFGIWSSSVRFARQHSKRQLQQYFHVSTGRAERLERPAAPSGAARGIAAVFGAGYATALTIVHLAAAGERDWAELLTELRAHIALERVLPPEVMPPA
ncbi:hypothetical protein ACWGJ9_08830 [Curtobacterium citreum]